MADVIYEDYDNLIENQSGYKLLSGLTLWLTGLPQSGKSTLAKSLYRELSSLGYGAYALDGDNLRLGINKDLGFSYKDRIENIRRAGEIALMLNHAGLIVIVALVSPYIKARNLVRERHALLNRPFAEIYIATDLSVCKARDSKGHYKKALANEITDFTGVNDIYEPPEDPEFKFYLNDETNLEEAKRALLGYVRRIT